MSTCPTPPAREPPHSPSHSRSSVALTVTLVATRARAQQPAGPKLPHGYRIDVIQPNAFGYYGADINDHGDAALTSPSPTERFNYLAGRWDRENGIISLAPTGSERSFSTGINKRGDVTVVYDAPGEYRFLSGLWSDGRFTDLGTIGRQTFAEDVNDQGVVVGWTERDTDARERYAFKWTRDGGMKLLPGLLGGESGTNAMEITERGLIVGYSYGPQGLEAVRWVHGQIQGLGDFSGGRHESIATSANDRGQIVGVGHVDAGDLDGDGHPDTVARAFLWSEERGMVNLGALGPDHNSVAYDVNKDGIVVGYSIKRPGGTAIQFTPFVWTEESGMVDLHTLLEPTYAGWRLGAFQMGRINDQGQILLHGEYYGQFSVVMLTPQNPEPGALLALGAACTVLAVRRRHLSDSRPIQHF